MRNLLMSKYCIAFYAIISSISVKAEECNKDFGLIIHGGAGSWSSDPSKYKKYKDEFKKILQSAYDQLDNDGKALDVIENAVVKLEDFPLTNAGRGAIQVGTKDGKPYFELDAAIMDGRVGKNRDEGLKAGAVTTLTNIKNPIKAARAVMDDKEHQHVLIVAKGAEKFAKSKGLETAPPCYFTKKGCSEDEIYNEEYFGQDPVDKFGTVGAAVLDNCGNLAAGTSTGGYSTKHIGRVGDVPVIGAGTYANNTTLAISGTGHGEYFIRYTVAKEVSSILKYAINENNKKYTLMEAISKVVDSFPKRNGTGVGGVIAIDKNGNIADGFNTKGMLRGYISKKTGREKVTIKITKK